MADENICAKEIESSSSYEYALRKEDIFIAKTN